MNTKRVFCCFDYDNDKILKDLLIGQSKHPDSPFEVSDWSRKEAAPEPSWEKEAEQRIKRSGVVVIVPGSRTFSASGVKKEVKMARENNLRIFQIRPQDTNPTPVPNGGTVYNWTWENLKNPLM